MPNFTSFLVAAPSSLKNQILPKIPPNLWTSGPSSMARTRKVSPMRPYSPILDRDAPVFIKKSIGRGNSFMVYITRGRKIYVPIRRGTRSGEQMAENTSLSEELDEDYIIPEDLLFLGYRHFYLAPPPPLPPPPGPAIIPIYDK